MDQTVPAAPLAPKPKKRLSGIFQRAADHFGWRLSPVNQRRLERFKAHKLGYRSFLIFSGLFLLTLFAEFIANDCTGKQYDSCVESPCTYASSMGCQHPKHPKNTKR